MQFAFFHSSNPLSIDRQAYGKRSFSCHPTVTFEYISFCRFSCSLYSSLVDVDTILADSFRHFSVSSMNKCLSFSFLYFTAIARRCRGNLKGGLKKKKEEEGGGGWRYKINFFFPPSVCRSDEWVKKWFPTECRLAWSLWTQRPWLSVINGPLAHFLCSTTLSSFFLLFFVIFIFFVFPPTHTSSF